MPHRTGSFTGLDDVRIFTQQWDPDDVPRAVVMLAHGIGEHSGRYAHVATYLAAHGYAVYALDHRGHGQSAGERVMVRDYDEFVADLRAYFEQARAAHPTLPIVLYGHSMGAIIGLLFALRYQDELAGLIVTGTALMPVAANRALVRLVKMGSALAPRVPLLPVAPVGVSRDPAVVDAYERDPLVYHGRLPLGMLNALARAVETCVEGLPRLRLPLLVMHGSADVLTSAAATELIRTRSTNTDLTIKVYEGLHHEIHNEPEQAEVFRDMVSWLDVRAESRE